MTVIELIELRKRMGLTQTEMGAGMGGLSLRAYQEIEAGSGLLTQRHRMLAERFALTQAIRHGGMTKLLPSSLLAELIKIMPYLVKDPAGGAIEFLV